MINNKGDNVHCATFCQMHAGQIWPFYVDKTGRMVPKF